MLRLLLGSVLLSGCSSSAGTSGSVPCGISLASADEIAATPREDAEAEGLALVIAKGIVADTPTYERIHRDLAAIRRHAADVATITFRVFQSQTTMSVSLTAEQAADIEAGNLGEWACLDRAYGLVSRTVIKGEPAIVQSVFKGRYRVDRIGCQYAQLARGRFAGTEGAPGDGPTILLGRDEADPSVLHYVFDRAGGDCPAGCNEHFARGFDTRSDGSISDVGTWDSKTEPARPGWFTLLPRGIDTRCL